jgi:hypothetical protein
MEKEEGRMEDGEWRKVKGEWRMENNGEWRMEDGGRGILGFVIRPVPERSRRPA